MRMREQVTSMCPTNSCLYVHCDISVGSNPLMQASLLSAQRQAVHDSCEVARRHMSVSTAPVRHASAAAWQVQVLLRQASAALTAGDRGGRQGVLHCMRLLQHS